MVLSVERSAFWDWRLGFGVGGDGWGCLLDAMNGDDAEEKICMIMSVA
jgi:hypothetical protein